MPGVHVGVDEPRADEHSASVDLRVDPALEAAPDVEDAVILVHDDAVGHERVPRAGEADDPPAPDQGSHASLG